MMKSKKININFGELNIQITYKKIKTLRLKISDECEITMSVPLWATKKIIFDFLNQQQTWINKTLAQKIKSKDKFVYLGNEYNLIQNPNVNMVIIDKNDIFYPNKKTFDDFLKQNAKEIFQKYIDKYLPIINKPINRVSIKKMKTRWGSCNSKKGYINLNIFLLKKNLEFCEYVILHELTHLIYPHHKKDFYDYIKTLMPDYKNRLKSSLHEEKLTS